MITKDEILEKLRDGVQADDLANEVITILNNALDDFQKEQEENIREEHKKEEAQEIADTLNDFYWDYYAESDDEDILKLSANDIMSICETWHKFLTHVNLSESLDSIKKYTKDIMTLLP